MRASGQSKDRPGIAGRPRHAAGLLIAGMLAFEGRAAAQEIKLSGPLAAPERIYAVSQPEAVAWRHDVTLWLALGGTPAPEKVAGSYTGLGGEITNGLLWTSGLLGIPSELRWGPWAEMWTDGTGGRVEGGLAAQLYFFGRREHSAVDLRLGGGSGEDALGRVPHVTVGFAGGPRYVEGIPWHETIRSEDGRPRTPQLIAGWRLFLVGRRTIEAAPQIWVSGGVELELGYTVRPAPESQPE